MTDLGVVVEVRGEILERDLSVESLPVRVDESLGRREPEEERER